MHIYEICRIGSCVCVCVCVCVCACACACTCTCMSTCVSGYACACLCLCSYSCCYSYYEGMQLPFKNSCMLEKNKGKLMKDKSTTFYGTKGISCSIFSDLLPLFHLEY
jgi:hypothetical protein